MGRHDDMETYWAREEHPADLPITEREAWHRDAWDREQAELSRALSPTSRNMHGMEAVDVPEIWAP